MFFGDRLPDIEDFYPASGSRMPRLICHGEYNQVTLGTEGLQKDIDKVIRRTCKTIRRIETAVYPVSASP